PAYSPHRARARRSRFRPAKLLPAASAPTHVSATRTPDHPGWRPRRAGNPDPAIVRIEGPAAVVEGRPPPFVVRIPVPAILVGPDPMSMRVRPPAPLDRGRIPYPTVARVLDPLPIGCQAILKDADVHLLVRRSWRRLQTSSQAQRDKEGEDRC